MTNLFKKAVCFTDIHFGKKNNDRQHNIDAVNFIKWAIEEGKKAGCDAAICLGDWSDNRRTLHVSTMNYSLYAMELLAENFKFYLINGNHDLYYKEKREINSVEFGRNIDNVVLVKEPLIDGNVGLIPWLVGDEWKAIPELKVKYLFGHFELPHFLLNAMVPMPDHGHLQLDSFKHPDYIFSGHFHKRQIKKNKFGKNVIYIGNAFPHNYSDAWDEERGIMILEWDKDPIFKAWPDQPTYRTGKLSQLLKNPTQYVKKDTSLRIASDIPLTYEENSFVKEVFAKHYNLREIVLVPQGNDEEDGSNDIALESEFQSVEQLVIESLTAVESPSIDAKVLVEIYRSL